VNPSGVADKYVRDQGSSYPQRIAECTFTDGTGFLLSLIETGGENRVEIYRCDKGLRIITPAHNEKIGGAS
jgi:hypothetical protein